MKALFYSTVFTCLFCCLHAQQIIKCTLLDSSSQKPIEFANVGLLNKGIGTVSNENGDFTLKIPDSLINHPIRLSMIGYHSKTINAFTLIKEKNIYLSANNVGLNEVVISSKKTKIKIVGNQTRTKKVSAGFTSNNLGTELAVKLNIKHPSTQIRKFFANINSHGTVNPIFRLNVYAVAKHGGPGDNILKQNIIINVKEMPCFIELDLLPYSIFVDDDVYI